MALFLPADESSRRDRARAMLELTSPDDYPAPDEPRPVLYTFRALSKKQSTAVMFREAKRPRVHKNGANGTAALFALNRDLPVVLPAEDNTPEGLKALLTANAYLREHPWPAPFDRTTHRLHQGDARDLSWIPDSSVHLVVTSPPYWTLKEYPQSAGQMGAIGDYTRFLDELDKVWRECARVLVGGGRICCVVGDVCIPRKFDGRHRVMPLHSDIQVRARELGLDCLTPIFWHKIANGVTEAEGNGAGFYGKPYQPGAVIKNDIEYILFLRKGGEYRSVPMLTKALSMLTRDEMRTWQRSIWSDIRGASTRDGHPAPYPMEVAERLVRLFSFAGDTVLDPFSGTGSTSLAAIMSGRNSIGNEIESAYVQNAEKRLQKAARQVRTVGAITAEVHVD